MTGMDWFESASRAEIVGRGRGGPQRETHSGNPEQPKQPPLVTQGARSRGMPRRTVSPDQAIRDAIAARSGEGIWTEIVSGFRR